MSTPTPQHASPETIASKRARFSVMAAITLAALLAAALFANVIGEKRSTRIDLTATREHTLAPRTFAVLEQLDSPFEIVVSADVRSLDARSMQRVRDVLDQFDQSSDQLGITIIDTATATSIDDFQRVVELLAEKSAPEVSIHRSVLEQSAQGLQDLATGLPRLAQSLLAVAQASAMADEQNISTQALLIGEVATSCARAADEVGAALANTIAGVPLPAADQAQQAANAPFQNAIATSDAVTQWADAVAQRARNGTTESQRAVAPLAAELASAANAARDQGAAAFDALTRLAPLEPLQIARALQVTPAVLVIGPTGTTAINLESLFPAFADQDTAGRAQLRFVGEELITTAISTLMLEHPPILAIVHAEPQPLFDDVGRLVNPAGAGYVSLIDRCRLRRMDVVEWAVALEPARPSFIDANPDGLRPIVWFVPGAPTRLNLDRADGMAERSVRIGHLGDAIQTLFDARANVLLAVEPSELPAAGQPDLLTRPLSTAFGITIDTGRPLIERIAMPDAVGFSAYQTPTPVDDNPIARALHEVKIALQWPMAVTSEQRDGTTVTPLLQIAPDDSIWGETQWLSYRHANDRQPFMSFAPRTPITRDSDRDQIDGPWVVAAAIEHTEGAPSAQRIVVVASPSWYEPIYEQAVELEGRRVTLYPGNRELFDASVWWLSNLDQLIAPAATSQDVPRIAQLAPAQLSMWRWLLIAGVPVLTLLCGVAFRMARG